LTVALNEAPDAQESNTAQFVDDARRRGLKLEVLSGVGQGNSIAFAGVLVESPGRAALFVAPWSRFSEIGSDLTVNVLRTARDEGTKRNNALIQTLVPHTIPELASCLSRAGFRRLTQLIYLRRRVSVESLQSAAQLEWHRFAPEKGGLFGQALEASYIDSLDCPELCGLRTPQEVLAGHKSTGDFDPDLWFVVTRHGEPAGILLLSALPSAESVEVVYMGVARDARGTGAGDALLSRAVGAARDKRMRYLALAVDSRNDPARRLYDRWGFHELTRRDAWIATPSAT